MKETFTITPLGAAVVDALPDQQKVKTIERAFKEQKICPTSGCFPNPESVIEFYSERGQQIRVPNDQDERPRAYDR